MRIKIIRITGIVLLLACVLAYMLQPADPQLTQPMINLRNDCLRQFAQPRFAAIHGKVPYLARPRDMYLDPSKPSLAESAAIRAFIPIAVECERRSMALAQPSLTPITYLFQVSQSPTIGGLTLLAEGQLTYMEYALIVDMQADESDVMAKMRAKRPAEQQVVLNSMKKGS